MKRALLVLAVLAMAQLSTGLANAKRVALVVGNDDYTTLPKLEKSVNDARGVGETLRGLGFQVFEGINAGRKDMEKKIAELEAAIEPGDEVFFFYAGHGVALGTENFLIPVDLPAPKPGDEKAVKKASISADALVGRIKKSGAGVSFLVFDACRNNPFQSQGTRSISGLGKTRGLARVDAPKGTLVLFSAGFGQAALDGLSSSDPNPNSVFTRSLIPLMKQPGITHLELAKQVQAEVADLAASVKHEQEPAIVDQVRGNIVLAPLPDNDVGSSEVAAVDPTGDQGVVTELDLADVILNGDASAETGTSGKKLDVKAAWAALEGSSDATAYEAFRVEYGAANPFFDRLAQKRLKELVADEGSKVEGDTKVALLVPKIEASPPAQEFAEVTDCDTLVASPFDEAAVVKGVDWNDIDAPSAVAACRSANDDHPNVARLEYQLARALEKSGEDSEAAKFYSLAGGKGHPVALYNLGVLYGAGRGVPRDDKEAYRLYSLAVEKGDVGAMTNLGIYYASGRGVEQDDAKAVELWSAASEKGDVLAMSNLGMMFSSGRGTERNDAEAAKLWKIAAKKGNAFAMFNLAVLLANGTGIEKDPDEAANLVIAALQLRHGGTMREMQGGAASFDADFKMALQRRLQEAGVYEGPIDGEFSEAVSEALVKITNGN